MCETPGALSSPPHFPHLHPAPVDMEHASLSIATCQPCDNGEHKTNVSAVPSAELQVMQHITGQQNLYIWAWELLIAVLHKAKRR